MSKKKYKRRVGQDGELEAYLGIYDKYRPQRGYGATAQLLAHAQRVFGSEEPFRNCAQAIRFIRTKHNGTIFKAEEPAPKITVIKPPPAQPASRDKSELSIKKFYDSWQWKRCRYEFLKLKERKCLCCGASAKDGAKVVVDHIKPIRKFWKLRLEPSNLQILCDDCNMGKGSHDMTDWGISSP